MRLEQVLLLDNIGAKPSGFSPGQWAAMTKQAKRSLVVCGHPLKVERYGGGLRYHCPCCDIRRGDFLPMIQWTNATPPKGETCQRQVTPSRMT
jgi:hypothetical protein